MLTVAERRALPGISSTVWDDGGVYAKICGLRRAEHVRVASEAGASAVGVVMNRTSSRRASEDEAREVVQAAAEAGVDSVLVVNDMPAEEAAELARRLGFDVLQLHGPAYGRSDFEAALRRVPRVWRATSVGDDEALTTGTYGEETLLLDAPTPGSGELWDTSVLTTRTPQGNWLLAGGLAPGNVADAVRAVRPWGVDVSSGVESAPGEKDADLIRSFLTAALSATD